ncbi:MAG: hypothetical protein KGY76_02325 [Candidatus Thermoplasmatota archaeon]|nr:hypothetical protein [Candidatus Thermoplasmatota archaeon]
MVEDSKSKNLRDEILRYKKEYWKIKGRIEELNEQEEELKEELERVRNHLSYYESLVSDMKKDMKGRKTSNVFERL